MLTHAAFLKLALFLWAAALFAQQPHTVTLTWTDTQNPTGTTYTVYRAAGACSATPSYASIASGIALKTYEDTGINPGKYCYAVTAVYSSEESDKSDPAVAQVKPFKPGNLNLTVADILNWLRSQKKPWLAIEVTVGGD